MSQALDKNAAKNHIPALELQLSIRPTSGVLGGLAACYFTNDESEKALPYAKKAFEKNKHAGFGMNLGLILKDLGRHKESLAVLQEAYAIDSSDPYLQLGYAEGMLRAGFWKQAWLLYDNSRQTQQGAALELSLPASVREWDGSPLPKDHLLFILPEGGAGDRICYPRFVETLTERGINWKLFPHEAFRSMFERIYPDKLVKQGDKLSPTHWTTAFALPAKLGITPRDIPPPVPIRATEEMKKKYRFERTDDLPIFGICYKAGEANQGGRMVRSLTEGQAMRIVCMTGDKIHWVSLQHEELMPYPVQNIPVNSWEEYAGLMANLDGIVTVDTSIMHLSGSMGIPTYTLLGGNSCWKFLDKGPCPWYPTSKLYRNRTHGFENAISQLIADLRK